MLAFTTALLGACSSSDVNESCERLGAVTPLCGTLMPEDLEPIAPDGGILVSEYGDGGNTEGAITWFQPSVSDGFTKLLDRQSITRGKNDEIWGDASCTAPDTLSPHGIHLSDRNGRQQLLVVNHSAREQVLFYEVSVADDSNTPPSLAWRGCVTFPDYAVLNDVAALPDGCFFGGLAVPRPAGGHPGRSFR